MGLPRADSAGRDTCCTSAPAGRMVTGYAIKLLHLTCSVPVFRIQHSQTWFAASKCCRLSPCRPDLLLGLLSKLVHLRCSVPTSRLEMPPKVRLRKPNRLWSGGWMTEKTSRAWTMHNLRLGRDLLDRSGGACWPCACNAYATLNGALHLVQRSTWPADACAAMQVLLLARNSRSLHSSSLEPA